MMFEKEDADLPARVSAALHDLDYFEQLAHMGPIMAKKRKKQTLLLNQLWQANQHLESIRDLGRDYDSVLVKLEVLRQIEERATLSATIQSPTSSTISVTEDSLDESFKLEDLIPEIKVTPSDARLPVLVPFMVQRHILVALESLLEAICFTVAQTHLPQLLREREWDCPEAASLPTWIEAINAYPDSTARSMLCLTKPHVQSVLALPKVVADRSPLSYGSLRESIAAGCNLLRLLDAETLSPIMTYATNFFTVLEPVSAHVEALAAMTGSQLDKLDDTMDKIADKRAALDAEEVTALQQAGDAVAEFEAKWNDEYKAAFFSGHDAK